MEHEKDHARDDTPGTCNSCALDNLIPGNNLEKAKGECSAYSAELECIGSCPANNDGCDNYRNKVESDKIAWCYIYDKLK